MLLNAIWQVPEELRIHNLTDRTIVIDSAKSGYADCEVWGAIDQYTQRETEDIWLLRETDGEQTRLIAIGDRPLVVEFWDTVMEIPFVLNWDGIGWSRGEEIDMRDLNDWLPLTTVDVESLAANVCQDLGLSHVDASFLRDNTVQIEFIERENINKFDVDGQHIYYHSCDSKELQYTADSNTLPPIEELDLIHCVDSDKRHHNSIIFIYDDEDGPMKPLLRVMRDGSLDFTNYENPTDDIVDMRNLVKSAIAHDGLVGHLYFIRHTNERGTIHRLFINMERFYPELAPFLSK